MDYGEHYTSDEIYLTKILFYKMNNSMKIVVSFY